jgi:hypothetical protein
MNLISCDNCGVVLDAEKIDFPSSIYKDGEVDESRAVWNKETRDFTPFTRCPV